MSTDPCQTPDDGQRYEVVGGAPSVSRAPILTHQERRVRLTSLLHDRAYESLIASEVGVRSVVHPGLTVDVAALFADLR